MSKVLIAEDDKFLASAYRLKFEKTNFEVKLASDGEEAVSLAKSFKPDVILLDLIMPKMNGFDVLSKLRADPSSKSTPILITSNLGQPDDIKKGMELGATDYFIKSEISLEDIVKKVESLVKNK
jgi:DNA-binding response OmpR family regulator